MIHEPRYDPDINAELGGTIEIGRYMFPVDLEREKVEAVLQEQADRYHGLVKTDESRYTELVPFGSAETYRLVYELEGEHLDREEVDRIVVFDRETDERLDLYRVDELLDSETSVQEELEGDPRSAE